MVRKHLFEVLINVCGFMWSAAVRRDLSQVHILKGGDQTPVCVDLSEPEVIWHYGSRHGL